MKLTGKANIDFYTWVNKEYPNVIFERASGGFGEFFSYDTFMEDIFDINIIGDIALNALIIEWLDSVGIYIIPFMEDDDWQVEIRYGDSVDFNNQFNSRQEATKAAIERANEIYNTQHFAK